MALARTFGMGLGVAIASSVLATAFPPGTAVGVWPRGADDVVRIGLRLGAFSAVIASAVSFFGHTRHHPTPGAPSVPRDGVSSTPATLPAR